MFTSMHQFDSALYYLDLCENLAIKSKDTVKAYTAVYFKAFVFNMMDKPDLARKIINKYPEKYMGRKKMLFCLVNASICDKLGLKEEATKHFEILEKKGTLEQKRYAYLWFANRKLDLNKPNESISYLKKHLSK